MAAHQKLFLTGGGPRRSVVLGERLGAGGEGEVFGVQGDATIALKILKHPARAARKIDAMLARPPGQIRAKRQDGGEVVQFAWPEARIENDRGQFLGFAMPRLQQGATVPIVSWSSAKQRAMHGLPRSEHNRLFLAANIAALLEYVNIAGHNVIDLRDQNIITYPSCHACLIDCDGMVIRAGTDIFASDVAAPTVLAPELFGEKDPRKYGDAQDRFALAVTLFMLLDNGRHPSSGSAVAGVPDDLHVRLREGRFLFDPASGLSIPAASEWRHWDDGTQGLFWRAFRGKPADRPSPAEWRSHLRELTNQARPAQGDDSKVDFGRGRSAPPPPRKPAAASSSPFRSRQSQSQSPLRPAASVSLGALQSSVSSQPTSTATKILSGTASGLMTAGKLAAVAGTAAFDRRRQAWLFFMTWLRSVKLFPPFLGGLYVTFFLIWAGVLIVQIFGVLESFYAAGFFRPLLTCIPATSYAMAAFFVSGGAYRSWSRFWCFVGQLVVTGLIYFLFLAKYVSAFIAYLKS